jgi:outer membrane protein assembly factor BamB
LLSSLPQDQNFEADRGTNMGQPSWDVSPYGLSARYGANINIYRLSTGEQLFNITTWMPDTLYNSGNSRTDHGKVAMWTQRGYFIAFDLFTGELAWRSEVTEYPWASSGFGAYDISSAYGMIFYSTYDGVYAFNWTNGKIVWNYKAPAYANFESPYITNGTEQYSFDSTIQVADGKLYTWNSEHTETYPLTRGWGVHCINATTGEGIWHISLPGTVGAIADGYATVANSRDGTMYVIGKGKSATTVTASPKTIAKGAPTLIEGTVLDMSPAQPGTPCVSKESMTTQMEYLHKQMPIAGIWGNETITGVPVTLTAIDENGVVTDLGTATTNGYYGTFSKSWTPSAEGKYEIIASFASDESYGSSAASTAVTVGPAAEQITFPEQITPADYTWTIVGMGIAIIVVVLIVGALLLLKKH